MLRSGVRICIDGGCFYSILGRGFANTSWRFQSYISCKDRTHTYKAISPRLAIKIDVNGWLGVVVCVADKELYFFVHGTVWEGEKPNRLELRTDRRSDIARS